MSLDRVRIAATAAAVFVLALHPPVTSGQTPVLDPDHRFEPWAWDFQSPAPDGHAVWKRHLFWEDNANTAFVLAHELVLLPGQTGSHPEVVLFNEAQFIPPVGVALASGELRKIALGSVADRGVQILVNARNSQIGGVPSITDLYPDPTFFIGVKNNDQIDPNYWSLDPTQAQDPISATRGAFGTLPSSSAPTTPTVPAFTIVPAHHQQAIPAYGSSPVSYRLDVLYITAGVGYPLATFADPTLAAKLERDRLMRYDPVLAAWTDESSRIPLSVRQGHSSGVCWADFNGDGFLDLFVGHTGDDFVGAQNYLLLYNATTGQFDIANATMMTGNQPYTRIDATWDVAAGDIDLDGDPDIVVANRKPRNAAAGTESLDYVLRNDGSAKFDLIVLSSTPSDSRSVALGRLFGHGTATIVFGNAGSDGYTNDLNIPVADDHPLEAYRWNTTTSSFDNVGSTFFSSAAQEIIATKPLTQQVLLADVTRPNGNSSGTPQDNGPDGKLDILLVNGRDILKHATDPYAGNVTVLANDYGTSMQPFVNVGVVPVAWARSAALADFCAGNGASAGSLDLFVGTGNRFHGTDSLVVQHLGTATQSTLPYNFDANTTFVQDGSYDRMPGNEFGYGFDFADCNGDGYLDAAQASRAYNFFVPSILNGMGDDHLDFVSPGTPGATDNRRGRLIPRGMEDAAFADFDGDFWPDLITVGDWFPSKPIQHGGANGAAFSSPLKVFKNDGTGASNPYSRLAEVGFPWANTSGTVPGFQYPMDARVDPNGRTAYPIPGLLDRVVPGDLNNDGKTDAIVHAFEVQNPSALGMVPVLGTGTGEYMPTGITTLDKVCFGFMYLENVYASGTVWLKDVFNTKMRTSPTGGISGTWNRSLGNSALIDIDNNGALDLYTTNGRQHEVGVTIATLAQANDLVFMNQGSADWGVLVAVNNAAPAIANLNGNPNQPPDSFGLAWGDVNNDGKVDVVTTHAAGSARAYPSLLMNQYTSAGATPYFADLYTANVPITATALDDAVHSAFAPGSATNLLDEAKYPCLFDFDADGDLDLVLAIGNNVPRFFQNKGSDTNNDGFIGPSEGNAGEFVDATDDLCRWIRPTVDCQDMLAIDPDRDGDLDLAMNPFSDEVVFWRNDMDASDLPTITDGWPRIGGRRGDWVIFEGADFTGVTYVELRFAGGVTQSITGTDVIVIDPRHLRVKLPTNSPVGLSQVRLRKRVGSTYIWSQQYFGYFVLSRKP